MYVFFSFSGIIQTINTQCQKPQFYVNYVFLLIMFILDVYFFFFIACDISPHQFCAISHSSLLFVWRLLLSEDGWLTLQISILGYKADFFSFFSVLCCFLNNSTNPWPLVCMHFLENIFRLGCISFLLLLKQNNQTWRLETRQTSIILWFRRLGVSYDFLNKKHCLERPGGSRGDSFPWLLPLYRAAYIGWSSSNHASLTSAPPSENSISRSLFPVSQFTNKEPYGCTGPHG